MKNKTGSLIGQIFRHKGKIYQILSESNTMLRAHSYDESCGVDTTVFISKTTEKIVATKSKQKKRS